MNTQITEDYVSFEVAKLLKEKGFSEPTCGFYHNDYIGTLLVPGPSNHNGSINSVSAPSQAHAMKWLREVNHIFIEIDYVVLTKTFFEYTYEIHNMCKGRSIAISEFRDNYETYEDACEAAIKYCLENLI